MEEREREREREREHFIIMPVGNDEHQRMADMYR